MFNFVKIEQNFQIFQRLKCAKIFRESNYETKKVCLDKTVNVNQFFLTFKLNIRFLSPAFLILNKIYLMPCFNEPNQLFLKIPPFFILNFHAILFPLWLVDYRSLDRLSTLDISNNTIVDIGEAFVNMPELKGSSSI